MALFNVKVFEVVIDFVVRLNFVFRLGMSVFADNVYSVESVWLKPWPILTLLGHCFFHKIYQFVRLSRKLSNPGLCLPHTCYMPLLSEVEYKMMLISIPVFYLYMYHCDRVYGWNIFFWLIVLISLVFLYYFNHVKW